MMYECTSARGTRKYSMKLDSKYVHQKNEVGSVAFDRVFMGCNICSVWLLLLGSL